MSDEAEMDMFNNPPDSKMDILVHDAKNSMFSSETFYKVHLVRGK